MADVIFLQVSDQIFKVVQWLTRHEELCVVLHEVRTVFFNLKALPGVTWILILFTFLCVTAVCTLDLARLLGFTAVLALGFALVVSLSVDQALPYSEILSDGVLSGHCALHPWVSIDLLKSRPVSRVKSHHFLKEILEFSGVDVLAIFGLSVCLPEEVCTTGGNQAIMRVLRVRRGERWSLRQNDKEDDGGGEQVDTGTLILLAQVNLWSHIARSAKLRLKQARAISTSDRSGET